MTQQVPTGLTLAQINLPPTADQWNTAELTVANTLGLPTTSWGPGAPERVILAVVANMQQQADVAASIAIQGGFLSFAAFGTVSWTAADGSAQTAFVTPDPSIPAQNPTGALGWLDVLADGAYNVQRILSSPAGGNLAILNTQATTYGPFAPGAYHVSQPSATGAPGYTNTASLTIPQSSSPGGVITAASNASPIAVTTTSPHGRATGDTVFIAGALGNTAANGAWIITVTGANSYTLNGSAGNGAYTASSATEYTPTLMAFTADVSGTGGNALPNTVNHSVTSIIGVSVSNAGQWLGTNVESNGSVVNRCRLRLAALSPNGAKGAYAFVALSAITLGPTLFPAVSVSSAITRVLVTATVGVVTVTIANATGAPGAADVTATDTVIQAFADPISVMEITQAASNLAVTVLATIYVPLAQVSAVGPVAQLAVNTYFQQLPIGGVTDPGGAANVMPIEGVKGAIFAACSAALITVQDLTMTLNGSPANLSMSTTQVANFTNLATFVAGTDLTVVGV